MDPQRMLHYLPALYRDGTDQDSVLRMLLSTMDRLQSPIEHLLDTLDEHFDPRSAPDRFIPYLASWLGLDRYFWLDGKRNSGARCYAAGMPQLRELVARTPELARWRGTRKGLEDFLEVATGITGFRVREDPEREFHLIVERPRAPESVLKLIERIVEEERPAYTTFEYRDAASLHPAHDSTQET